MNRQEIIRHYQAHPQVPVLIVGGGVNGIATFRDLALQGVSVLLVEQNDFASGASAASSHMVHGGIRYLENGEFRLVNEALHERNRLLLNAPHYVKPLPTTIPLFKWFSGIFNAPFKFLGWSEKPSERGIIIIKLGLMLYDFYANFKRSMPTHELRLQTETREMFPSIHPDVQMTATYYDAWMPYPERLCMEMVMDAQAENPNAHALNYMAVVGGGENRVVIQDTLSGERWVVHPQQVINAAGPWIDFANEALQRPTHFIGGTKGSHLVIDHPELRRNVGEGEIFFENHDGRITLMLPYFDRVMLGTTDIRIDHPDQAVLTADEVEYMLDMVKRVFPSITVQREQIVFSFSGVRPLPSMDANTTGQISRDHSIRTLEAGNGTTYPIHAMVGGKWTTMRAFGEQMSDAVLTRLKHPRAHSTADRAIGGGRDYPTTPEAQYDWQERMVREHELDPSRVQTLFERYGTYAEPIIAHCANRPSDPLLTHHDGYSHGEVEFITQHEQVHTLTDFVLRRSLMAMLGQLSLPLLHELAGIMGDALGWDEAQRLAQVEATLQTLQSRHRVALSPEQPSRLAL